MSTSLETLERVWNANPGGLAFAQYAEALHRQGRSRDAHAILVDGVVRWPNHFAGKVLLGRLSQELGDLDTARVAFQDAVHLDSNSPVALRSLAMVLGRQQYQRQAIDLWVRLSQLDPSDQEAASTARRLLSDLETTSSLADLGLGIQESEDPLSREALSEGASSGAGLKGMSTLDSDSPLAGLGGSGMSPMDAAFDLGDLAFPAPPSITPATTWSPSPGMESTVAQAVVPPSSGPGEISVPSMGPSGDDSGLATLEMASFPARTIPPPPLELSVPVPPAPVPAPRLQPDPDMTVVLPPLAQPTVFEADVGTETQFMPRDNAPVTGDDVGARLDALFGEPAPLPTPPSAAPTARSSMLETGAAIPNPAETADLHLPPMEAIPSTPPATATSAAARAPVTGDDIGARLDDLFGESSFDLPLSEPPAAPVAAPAPAAVVEARPELAPAAPESSASGVVGTDIEARLDNLFGEEPAIREATLMAGDTSAMDRSAVLDDIPSEVAEATLENMRAFETAAAPRDSEGLTRRPEAETSAFAADTEVGGSHSTVDMPTVGDMPAVPPPAPARLASHDLDSQLDELFASSEFLLEDAAPPAPRKVASPTGPVTGDDIGDRLDDLFGIDDDFPAGVPTVTLAEEYLRQGYRDQALAVYRQLAGRDPANADIARRIAQIEASGT